MYIFDALLYFRWISSQFTPANCENYCKCRARNSETCDLIKKDATVKLGSKR